MLIRTIKLFVCMGFLLVAGGLVSAQDDPIPVAISKLSSPDREIRYFAVNTLCKPDNDGPQTTQALLEHLSEPDDQIQMMIVRTLAARKEKRAVPELIAMLDTATVSSWGTIAEALGNIGDPAAVEPLIAELAKGKPGTKWSAVLALGKFNDPRATRPLFDVEGDSGETLPKAIGSSGVEEIADILKHGSPAEREKASRILAYIADERSLNALISALDDKADNVASNAVWAISGRMGSVAINPLAQAYPASDAGGKLNIIRTLARIEDDAIGGVLIELFSKSDVFTRVGIVQALAESLPQLELTWPNWQDGSTLRGPGFFGVGSPDAIVPVMLVAAGDKEPAVRTLALTSLGGTIRDDVHQTLLDALKDTATKTEAALALGARGDTTGLPVVFDALKSENTNDSSRAQFVLVKIGEPAVIGLIDVLNDKNKEFPLREIRRIEERKKARWSWGCGNEPPPPVLDPRALAATALGHIGDERARPALTRALKDKGAWLSGAAEQALKELDIKAARAQ